MNNELKSILSQLNIEVLELYYDYDSSKRDYYTVDDDLPELDKVTLSNSGYEKSPHKFIKIFGNGDYYGSLVDRSNREVFISQFPNRNWYTEYFQHFGYWSLLIDLTELEKNQDDLEDVIYLLGELYSYPLIDDEHLSNLEYKLAEEYIKNNLCDLVFPTEDSEFQLEIALFAFRRSEVEITSGYNEVYVSMDTIQEEIDRLFLRPNLLEFLEDVILDIQDIYQFVKMFDPPTYKYVDLYVMHNKDISLFLSSLNTSDRERLEKFLQNRRDDLFWIQKHLTV